MGAVAVVSALAAGVPTVAAALVPAGQPLPRQLVPLLVQAELELGDSNKGKQARYLPEQTGRENTPVRSSEQRQHGEQRRWGWR